MLHTHTHIKKNNNDRNQLLEKTNKMNKSLASLIKRKKGSTTFQYQIERIEGHPTKNKNKRMF